MQNIGTHESGHSFGLADIYDTEDSEQTMYGYAGTAETKKRTLEWGDRAGVADLYPTSGYSVTFYTNPTSFTGSAGTITFSGTSYSNGQTGSYASGDYTATANAPSGYRFEFWTYSGSSGSGVYVPNISLNPTTVQVRGTGWLKAVFSGQVTFYTNPSTVGSISWGSCSNPGKTNGQTVYEANLPPDYSGSVVACANAPSGYTFTGWSCTGGLSCSGSSTSTNVAFSGPGSITAAFSPVAVTTTVTSTVRSTIRSTSYTTRYTTTTVTSYTGTSTLTSTVPVLTTLVLLPLTVTSTVSSTAYTTPHTTTTVTSYTSTATSTSTVVVTTTVTATPTATVTVTSTSTSTSHASMTTTITVTSYTSTHTSTSIVVVTTTVTELPTVTVTSTVPVWSTKYATSTLTTTATSYTSTTTLTSTELVYTTVTTTGGAFGASPGRLGGVEPFALVFVAGFIAALRVFPREEQTLKGGGRRREGRRHII